MKKLFRNENIQAGEIADKTIAFGTFWIWGYDLRVFPARFWRKCLMLDEVGGNLVSRREFFGCFDGKPIKSVRSCNDRVNRLFKQ